MDCRRFREEIEACLDPGGLRSREEEHLARCAPCRMLLARARILAREIEALPPLEAPAALSVGIRRGAAPSRRFPILRVAGAALVCVAVGGLAWGLLPGNGEVAGERVEYSRLDLRVVVEEGNEALEEEFALDEIHGPDAVMFLALSSERGMTNGR